MLRYITLILVCQLAGEIAVKIARVPIPGPVVGMVVLFCWLCCRRKIPEKLEVVTGFLHGYLPLLFVPAGVGIITNIDLLINSLIPFSGAIIVGTAMTIAVTGLVMQFLNRRHPSRRPGQAS